MSATANLMDLHGRWGWYTVIIKNPEFLLEDHHEFFATLRKQLRVYTLTDRVDEPGTGNFVVASGGLGKAVFVNVSMHSRKRKGLEQED